MKVHYYVWGGNAVIDNRHYKVIDYEIDDALQGISDTSILLNFQQAITDLYPSLIPIHAFEYNAWDDIVEPLFLEMVYKTFAFKYGININFNETHKYEYSLGCSKGIHHIECIPKNQNFKAMINYEWILIDKNDLNDKLLIFNSFGDGEHFISSGLYPKKANNVKFNLVEVYIVSALTGLPLEQSTVFIHKDDLDFEFVAETYDSGIKKTEKSIWFLGGYSIALISLLYFGLNSLIGSVLIDTFPNVKFIAILALIMILTLLIGLGVRRYIYSFSKDARNKMINSLFGITVFSWIIVLILF